jgi:hypothetical protein
MDANQEAFEETEREAPAPAFYTVAIYLVTLGYGGPEEGGWWFDRGELVDDLELVNGCNLAIPKIFVTEEEACKAAEMIQDQLDASVNKGRRPISSVLSTGRYHAEVHDGYPPKHYPETRPHYE